VLALFWAAPCSTVNAHGRPLGVNQLFRVEGRDVLFTTRGPVLEGADGVYRWSCSRPYGDSGQALIPNLARTHAGATLAGTIAGLYRRAPSGCAWTRASSPLELAFVGDVFALPTVGAAVYAVTADPTSENVIARSADDGLTFDAVTVGSARLQSVRVAPSDPSRVVAAGFVPGATTLSTPAGALLVSDDGGASFDALEVPLQDGELTLVVTHIPRHNPLHVWLRTVSARAPDSPPERLLRVDVSTGAAVEVLTRQQLRGAAEDPSEGGAAWVLSAPEAEAGGLLRVAADGGVSVRSAALDASCVLDADGALYVCPIPSTGRSAALERSLDGGRSFERVLAFEDIVETDGCREDDSDVSACAADFDDLQRDAQALLVDPPSPPAGGGCAVAGPSGGPGAGVVALSLVVALGGPLRRRGR
jgi:hypothetical protein